MSDNSCGGSTPFKRIVDHTNRDASHHQDRLVDNAASQGQHAFRSAPQHPGQQDNFNSFMQGNAALPTGPHDAAGRLAAHAAALGPAHHAQAFPAAHHAAPAPAATGGLNNWAADFARFSSGGQSPTQHQRTNGLTQQAAMMNPQMQHQTALAAAAVHYQMAPYAHQPNFGFSPLYGPTNGGFTEPTAALAQRPAAEKDFQDEMDRWMAVHGNPQNAKAMDDVDAIMEQMARELELNEAALLVEAEQQEIKDQHEEASTTTTDKGKLVDTTGSHLTDLETPEISSLSLENRVSPETPQATNATPTMEEEDAVTPKPVKSDVAEAAERLLESVQDEDGEKWKNSVFLSLMRDFRDGRKDIVDNEVRDTNGESSKSAGDDAVADEAGTARNVNHSA